MYKQEIGRIEKKIKRAHYTMLFALLALLLLLLLFIGYTLWGSS